jgi:hypothetical protein
MDIRSSSSAERAPARKFCLAGMGGRDHDAPKGVAQRAVAGGQVDGCWIKVYTS